MKRRDFLSTVATGAVAAAAVAGCSKADDSSSASAPAVAMKKRTLKMVTAWPKNFPGFGTSAERFAERVRTVTDGALDIKVYAAGELVGAFESFDAVSLGNADMYHAADYYFQGKHKALNFFTAVPFGFTADEMASWIHYGGGQKLWDEVSGKFNIKPMIVANSGTQMAGWYKKEINSLEDFKGLRIRWPGLGGEVIRRLGAAVNAMPGGDIFQALQSGAIDAAEWIGPWNDMALGFHTIASYYYYPGFHEPGSSITLGVNKDVWESFSPVAAGDHHGDQRVRIQPLARRIQFPERRISENPRDPKSHRPAQALGRYPEGNRPGLERGDEGDRGRRRAVRPGLQELHGLPEALDRMAPRGRDGLS